MKENQIFGKRGGTRIQKEIVTLLQGFFQAGNANKSDRYSAEDMYAELNDMANAPVLYLKLKLFVVGLPDMQQLVKPKWQIANK